MPAKFPQRKLGDDLVSAQGLGCMGMHFGYTSFGGQNDEDSFKVLTRAADLGINFWDTSDVYGPYTNEKLLGRWFKETGRRDEIFLATKFGHKFVDGNMLVDCSPGHVKKSCSDSLERLQTDRIDLYYCHRIDSKVPIEHTVQAMVELKNEGKIRYFGLSECSSRTLSRAHKVHPITAIQVEYSPFSLDIESEQTGLLKTARELGVKIVAYSPLGRGFLTGSIRSRDDFDEKDVRKILLPRFSDENFPSNLKLADSIASIAKERGCTPGQLVLAWVLAQGDDFIPIPGTKRIKYLEENAQAVEIKLSEEAERQIRKAIDSVGGAKGARYPPARSADLFGDTPELDAAS